MKKYIFHCRRYHMIPDFHNYYDITIKAWNKKHAVRKALEKHGIFYHDIISIEEVKR